MLSRLRMASAARPYSYPRRKNYLSSYRSNSLRRMKSKHKQIYLAAMYSLREQIKEHAALLKREGFSVTSTWLRERKDPKTNIGDCSDRFLCEHAVIDIRDIRRADVFVIFTVEPTTPTLRGGRHVETGIALALDKQVIVCGPRENIFHFLPQVLQFDTFDSVLTFLKSGERA